MPLPVTHVLLTVILVDLYRDYSARNSRFLSLHAVLIAGIAAVMPDADIALNWFLRLFGYRGTLFAHGGITHTPIAGLIFLIPAAILYMRGKQKESIMFCAVCFGILMHIFLDWLIGGGAVSGVMVFWPLSAFQTKLHLFLNEPIPHMKSAATALILLGWLWHEEVRHKISGFI